MMSSRLLAAAIGAPAPSEEQERVIEAPLRSAVVLAGAGSGKTETVAARVVWLVANGLALPEQVLGLTFTRSAARGLTARIRARLGAFAASPLLERADPTGRLGERLANSEPQVMTYDAYAGELVGRWGLLLGGRGASAAGGLAAGRTVLSDAGMWQLAYATAAGWESELAVDRNVAGVAEAVLALGRRMAEQLVGPQDLTQAATLIAELVETLPRGPRQRAEPSQELRSVVAVSRARVELLGLVHRVQERLQASGAVDFATQMAIAAQLAAQFPQVRADEAARHRVVLLDEYQDTGHAQRVMLKALFGGGGSGSAVMAVGDPHQSVYAWRGAQVGNLAAFAQDFAAPDALTLMTSWRNPVSVLSLANQTSAALRAGALDVPELQPRPQAPEGEIRVGLFGDAAAERRWIAERISAQIRRADETKPTAAVLVRRNADALLIAEALTAAGLEAQVVGLGGLLAVPEVCELVAMLELIADPSSSTAALQVLTAPRWRIGAADLVALARRADSLSPVRKGPRAAPASVDELIEQLVQILAADHAAQVGLGDALVDLGELGQYSPSGGARLTALASELDRLRSSAGRPLPEFVTLVERVLGAGRTTGAVAKERLAAFAAVVAEHSRESEAAFGSGGLAGLVSYLRVAETVERGLSVGEVAPDPTKVQVLTVHAAKGLEWDVVAVAHLSAGVFPTGRARSTWVGDLTELPPRDIDELARAQDRAELQEALKAEREGAKELAAAEERRLAYVAVTRARQTLLLSGHWWPDEGAERPLGPSEFLLEWRDALAAAGGEPDVWEPPPAQGEANPLVGEDLGTLWPPDPLAGRRETVQRGADLVLSALISSELPELDPAAVLDPDPDFELFEAVAALLDDGSGAPETVVSRGLTVSDVVDLAVDSVEFERKRARRGPRPPARAAQAGIGFHEWVQRWYLSEDLIDLDDLPGAADDEEIATDVLRQAFLDSPWADRSPVAVEAPFELNLGGVVVRGRIDAVFAEAGGGFTVVDWKTGRADLRKARVQLSIYRLAWQRLTGATEVKGAVHEVTTGLTREFEDLMSAAELTELLGFSR